MPARSDDPLRRVTLNLYEADCAFMERIHGQGWTTRVREILHARVEDTKKIGAPIPRRVVADLERGEYAHNDPSWNADTDGDADDD